MSRGQPQTRTLSGKRILERCKEKEGTKDTIFIDVDNGKFDDIIIIDIPESSKKRTQGSSASLEHKKYPSNNIISIDDDDESSDNEKNRPSNGGLDRDSDATSSKASSSASSQSPNSEESNCDECQFIQEKNFPVKLSKCKRTYSEKTFSRNCIGSSPISGSSSSESDISDCELMECSSGKIREQWERASVRKKTFLDVRNGHSGFNDQASASGCFTDAAKNIEVDNLTKHADESFCSTSSNENDEKQNLSTSTDAEDGISADPYFNHEEDDRVEELHKNVDRYNSWRTTQLQEELQFLHRIFDMQDTGKNFSGQYSCDENELQNDGSVNEGKTILQDKEKTIREPSLTSSRQRIDLQFSSGKDRFLDKGTNVSSEPSCLKTQSKQDRQLNEDKDAFSEDDTSLHDNEKSDEKQINHEKMFPRDEEKGNLGEESFSTESLNATNFESASFNYMEKPGRGDVSFCESQPDDMTKVCIGIDEPGSGKCFSLNTQVPKEKEIKHEEVHFCDREKPLLGELHLLNARQHEIHFTYRRSCSKVGEALPQSQVESIHLLNAGDGDERHNIPNSIIGEREKFKQTKDYKRAAEEEWASRQRQLQIQDEEAQRMRKRKKAETLRLLDMERRQKQRLEEMRETHKKNVETINLKEHLRSKVRKELDKLAVMHNDMASLLRCLGIHVLGGLCPTSHEVNAAYKQALLRFHPDRASRTDIQQQVEAEEKFKLVSRLKEKLLPT